MNVTTIFGPPGTGKTRQLIDFIQQGSGLFMSYTKAAAAEALSRLQNARITPSTLHAHCYRQLSMARSQVVDKAKLGEFARVSGIPFQGSEPGSDEPQEGDEFLAVYQYANNADVKYTDAWDRFGRPGTFDRFAMFMKSYVEWKRTYGYMDFDDMLIKFLSQTKMMRVPRLFVDEAQDCTTLQWKVIRHICKHAAPAEVYLAGDDDQAIYEWSGANPHGMVEFTDEHKGTMMVLAKSYRVPIDIAGRALAVIHRVERRVAKVWRPREGADGCCVRYGDIGTVVDQLQSLAPNGAMVLVRDRFKLEEVKKTLHQDLIPYDTPGGFSPWTSVLAKKLRAGHKVEIPPVWQHFYSVADLSKPVLYHLSTIHQAKGREADTVVLDLDCPTRVLAGIDLNPDAERRVQYVGMTRAKETLIMCGSNPVVP